MNQDLITSLQQDFAVCRNYLKKVAATLISEKISKYPVFVVIHEGFDLDLGVPIIRHEELGTHFTFNASHLEDFVNKQIIEVDKTAIFAENFKDADKFCCLFLADGADSNFVFMPYDAETIWEPKNREELN